jgi:hypothetical protein
MALRVFDLLLQGLRVILIMTSPDKVGYFNYGPGKLPQGLRPEKLQFSQGIFIKPWQYFIGNILLENIANILEKS